MFKYNPIKEALFEGFFQRIMTFPDNGGEVITYTGYREHTYGFSIGRRYWVTAPNVPFTRVVNYHGVSAEWYAPKIWTALLGVVKENVATRVLYDGVNTPDNTTSLTFDGIVGQLKTDIISDPNTGIYEHVEFLWSYFIEYVGLPVGKYPRYVFDPLIQPPSGTKEGTTLRLTRKGNANSPNPDDIVDVPVKVHLKGIQLCARAVKSKSEHPIELVTSVEPEVYLTPDKLFNVGGGNFTYLRRTEYNSLKCIEVNAYPEFDYKIDIHHRYPYRTMITMMFEGTYIPKSPTSFASLNSVANVGITVHKDWKSGLGIVRLSGGDSLNGGYNQTAPLNRAYTWFDWTYNRGSYQIEETDFHNQGISPLTVAELCSSSAYSSLDVRDRTQWVQLLDLNESAVDPTTVEVENYYSDDFLPTVTFSMLESYSDLLSFEEDPNVRIIHNPTTKTFKVYLELEGYSDGLLLFSFKWGGTLNSGVVRARAVDFKKGNSWNYYNVEQTMDVIAGVHDPDPTNPNATEWVQRARLFFAVPYKKAVY
ncbi:hypothetical protein [Vibrio phage vB_VpS_PG28]|nr:hypothetical protein [Vibrio phage vB_VpS_PG28]